MKPELKLNLTPTESDFKNIEVWLLDEYNSLNEGFYCNWSTIEKAYNNKKIVTINLFDEPVGFIVWTQDEITAEIDIFEIKPDQRGKGIGKYFHNQFSEYLKLQKFIVIKLFCSPRTSENFWKNLGFIKFPERDYEESDLTYYKPLIEVLATADKITEHKIELWDVEPHQIENKLPKWTWYVELTAGKLIKPIIQPCDYKWNLRWSKNGTIIKEGKIKHFSTDKNRIEYSPFLYIDKLME